MMARYMMIVLVAHHASGNSELHWQMLRKGRSLVEHGDKSLPSINRHFMRPCVGRVTAVCAEAAGQTGSPALIVEQCVRQELLSASMFR